MYQFDPPKDFDPYPKGCFDGGNSEDLLHMFSTNKLDFFIIKDLHVAQGDNFS